MNNQKETPEQILQMVKDEVAKEWIHHGEKIYRTFDEFLYCSHGNRPEMNEVIKRISERFHSEMLKTLLPTEEEIEENKNPYIYWHLFKETKFSFLIFQWYKWVKIGILAQHEFIAERKANLLLQGRIF